MGTVAVYGLFAVWYAALAPLAVPFTGLLATVPQAVPLDTDIWTRRDDPARGFAFAIPPDWLVDASDPATLRLGRSARELATAGTFNGGIVIAKDALPERQEAANAVAEDFAGSRAATYDVMVDGRPAVFAIAFENARVKRQAVYIPDGKNVIVVGAAQADPAVFAALVSTIKFYAP